MTLSLHFDGRRSRSASTGWALIVGTILALQSGCHGTALQDAPPSAPDSPAADKAPSAPGVTLKPEEAAAMGIIVSTVQEATHAPQTSGFAVVAAHEAIAQAAAELAAADAAERQSRAALARTQRLAGTAGALPAEALESAQRQATVDASAALLARQRLTANFGQKPPWGDSGRSGILRALGAGEIKLVRVTFPLGSLNTDAAPTALRFARIDDFKSGKAWTSTAIWSAPADAAIPGRSFFALLSGAAVGEGERLLAWAPTGAPRAGTLVPASAAVISDSEYWCYVEHKAGVFTRIRIDTGVPSDGGYFVETGVLAGDRVVTAGAGQLLAREMNPGAAAD